MQARFEFLDEDRPLDAELHAGARAIRAGTWPLYHS
jgi:hypothetical protein